jgi:hypothetical protein
MSLFAAVLFAAKASRHAVLWWRQPRGLFASAPIAFGLVAGACAALPWLWAL